MSEGRSSLETHVNRAGGTLQLMPEYSYGVRRGWELSLQLPIAEADGRWRSTGYRVELQYVAPHDEEQGFYWGWNGELGRVEDFGERREWAAELVPILGIRRPRWHVVANPALGLPLSGEGRTLHFDPAGKVAYRLFGENEVGLEYYAEAGPLRRFLPRDERARLLFVTWDGRVGRSQVNLGLGRGLSPATDRWVVKMIVEIAFR